MNKQLIAIMFQEEGRPLIRLRSNLGLPIQMNKGDFRLANNRDRRFANYNLWYLIGSIIKVVYKALILINVTDTGYNI